MSFVRIILDWLLAPRRLLSLAALSATIGLVWLYATLQENADRTLALRQGPPAAVAVEHYRGAADRGPAGEIVLEAMADPEAPLVLTLPGSGERALVVPLFPRAGGDRALGAIFVPLAAEQRLPEPGALATAQGDGRVTVNGRGVDSGDFALMLAGALAVEGRHLGERFVAVEPYLDGREAALQPIADHSMDWLWPMALALVLVAGAGWRRFAPGRRRRRSVAVAVPARVAAPAALAQFPPLRRQEEVAAPDPAAAHGAWAAVAAAAGIAVILGRALLRGLAGVARLVWAGVAEIRSPR